MGIHHMLKAIPAQLLESVDVEELGIGMAAVAIIDGGIEESILEIEAMGAQSIGYGNILEVAALINVLDKGFPPLVP